MLIQETKILFAMAGLIAFAAIPSYADSRDRDDEDRSEQSVVYGGDFALTILSDGLVEASVIVDPELSVSSAAVRSEDLDFGPLQEVEPGLWIASAIAPVGTECYAATAEFGLVKKNDSEDDDSDHDDRDSDRDSDKNRVDKDRDDHKHERHERRDEGDHDTSSVTIRLGTSICAPAKTCESPVAPPVAPPVTSPISYPTPAPLGMFP